MIAALLLAAAATTAAETDVGMAAKAFAPARVTVLVGERVTWTNHDNAAHTVTAVDRSFDSGSVHPGGTYTRRFSVPGQVAYRCTLHRFMQGAVEVVAVELHAPRAVPAGKPAELTGRAPQPGAAVELERVGAGTVATTVADDEGQFRFRVDTAGGPARYRARSGGQASATVDVAVAPEVRLAARRGRHGVSIRVHVLPSQPGAGVLIERHERERFGYVPLLRRALRLDASSRGRAYVRTHRRLRLRARLTRPLAGWAQSSSGVVVVPRSGGSRAGGHHPH